MVDMIPIFQLLSVMASWSISQLIKGSLGHMTFDRKSFLSTSGGMPSSHTSSASAFFFSELFFHGVTSLAVLALMFMVVIAVDAIGVRYTTGHNARILFDSLKGKPSQKDVLVKNGHTKIEVFAGVILGLVVALIIFSVV